MKNSTVRHIMAFGAIAASIGVVLLTAGYYLRFGEFAFFFIASAAMMPMLYYKSAYGYCLSLAVSVFLTLVFTGFNILYVFPYLVLFGHYPLTRFLLVKTKLPSWLTKFIRLAIFEAGMILTWRFTTLLIAENETLNKYMLPIVAVVSVAVFFPYDEAVRRLQLQVNRFIAKGRLR